MLYCFPVADVLLCMDPEQGWMVCVCVVGGGGGRREEDCLIDISNSVLSLKRISCSFPRDIA